MTETNPLRPVPHIQHTPALEAAAIAVTNAKCCTCDTGLPIVLCENPLDVNKVRGSLQEVSSWFKDPHFFFSDEHVHGRGNGELAAVENLILLATLLREHLRAGNVT